MSDDPFATEEPVTVIDRLQVRPGCQGEVLRRIDRDYAPPAAERGLEHVGCWVLPPFERARESSEIVLQWRYASLGALWSARGAEEVDPQIAGFWTDLAPLLTGRTRNLGRPGSMPIPPRADEGAPIGLSARTIRFFAAGENIASAAARLKALGMNGGINAGGYTFLPGGITVEGGEAELELEGIGPAVEAVRIEPVAGGLRRLDLNTGVKRTILLRTMAGATPADVELLEDRLCGMAQHLREMLNWTLSRVVHSDGAVAWTHCIEQEYEDVAHVTGAYLNHPFHWAVADRLFHPEAPERVADAFFQSIYPLERSMLARFVAGPPNEPRFAGGALAAEWLDR